jgi:AcrR family transcriptional regulator
MRDITAAKRYSEAPAVGDQPTSSARSKPVVAGSAQRVERILDAARELIREGGVDNLSMRSLAQRAKVSPMTTYNLIGSREQVLVELVRNEMGGKGKGSKPRLRIGSNHIDNILNLADYYLEYLAEDPLYMKAIISTYYSIADTETRNILDLPRRSWWAALIGRASDAGEIRKDADHVSLVMVLDMLLADALHEWVIGGIDIREVGIKTRYTFALVIMSVVDDSRAPYARTRFLEAQGALVATRAQSLRWAAV